MGAKILHYTIPHHETYADINYDDDDDDDKSPLFLF
jgi:hypothetical protein